MHRFHKWWPFIVLVGFVFASVVLAKDNSVALDKENPDVLAKDNEVSKFYLKLYHRKWNAFLKTIPVGTDEEGVKRSMKGKFRDVGDIPLGGSGVRDVIYMIDDTFQARFSFDGNRKLVMPGVIEKKQRWLRFPDRTVLFLDK